MSQCPKCGGFLEEESGMATCPACGAFVFIEYSEGQAPAGQQKATLLSEPESEPSGSNPFHSAQDAGPESVENPSDPLQDLFSASPTESPGHESIEPQSSLEPQSDPELERSSEPEPEYNPGIAMMGDFESPAGGLSPADHFGPADDPLGLNEYANSEISQAKDGLLHFRILISGIDTKEIRQSLREAMEDSRFNWDSASIMAGIRFGELKLDHVTPVKATILINRIKRLPIRIRWEQYAITQSDGSD
jgi:uncharacterized Zn finger protein (UPF0148 family)